MRRVFPVIGWLAALSYFGIIAALNVAIVRDFYWPEGPWPGWAPLIEGDLLYGGCGVLVVLAVRWAWRRLATQGRTRAELA